MMAYEVVRSLRDLIEACKDYEKAEHHQSSRMDDRAADVDTEFRRFVELISSKQRQIKCEHNVAQ